ncbi:MAG: hypothetical protein ACRC2V_05130 [Xenococcaceae cyanobacterium]
MNIETEAINRIIELHLNNLVEKQMLIRLNASQVLSIAELLEASLNRLPLNDFAFEGFEELSQIFKELVFEVYPEIEVYCDRVTIFER